MSTPPGLGRLRAPPSSVTGDLYAYLLEIRKAMNSVPQLSYFSAATPNSTVTGLAGHIAINLHSASTDSRVWVMGGNSLSVATTLGWVVLRTSA